MSQPPDFAQVSRTVKTVADPAATHPDDISRQALDPGRSEHRRALITATRQVLENTKKEEITADRSLR